jgi:hypothetical protein
VSGVCFPESELSRIIFAPEILDSTNIDPNLSGGVTFVVEHAGKNRSIKKRASISKFLLKLFFLICIYFNFDINLIST